jgi:hypothetical protein
MWVMPCGDGTSDRSGQPAGQRPARQCRVGGPPIAPGGVELSRHPGDELAWPSAGLLRDRQDHLEHLVEASACQEFPASAIGAQQPNLAAAESASTLRLDE